MASKKSAVIMGLVRTAKPLINQLDRQAKDNGLELLSKLKKPPADIAFEEAADCPLKAVWCFPQKAPKEKMIFYIHGGAYETGTLLISRAFIMNIAHTANTNAFAFEYRLAPEHPYPAALEDALAAYRYVLAKGYHPSDVTFVGDSAGGGLALALMLKLKQLNEPLPASVSCLSPWADLTDSSSTHMTRAKDDPALDTKHLHIAALNYAAGEDLKNPFISPVFAHFGGFPPILIHVGTLEILLGDSLLLYNKMKQVGVDVRFKMWEDMWHVFQAYDIPESEEAMGEIADFIHETLGEKE